ncbi:MAG: hypothetical protein LBT50_04385 [Prevotellaceae bacterium]|nr:hypothetical protein [Prevotellaceae bacterium]
MHYNDFFKFNDQYYYIQVFNDTLYNIGNTGINPFLTISKGGLKASADMAIDVKKRKTEGHKYILGDYGFLRRTIIFIVISTIWRYIMKYGISKLRR